MSEQQEKLTRMQRQVSEGLADGRVPAAKAALSRSWRDAVPELPIRFSVALKDPKHKATRELLRRARRNEGAAPPLCLRQDGGKTYVETVRGKRLRIGRLPGSDARILEAFGKDAKLYRPQLLEVRYDDENRVRYVAIEMVRGEIYSCPSCKKRHSGPHAYCDRCRKEGREGQGFEHTPVQIQEAVEAVIADEADLDEELPI